MKMFLKDADLEKIEQDDRIEIELDETEINVDFLKRKKNFIITSVVLAAFLCVGVFLLGNGLSILIETYRSEYEAAEEEKENEVYNEFWERSFELAEANYHVSNRVTIQIERIQEEAKLEVLRASDVSYQIYDESKGNIPVVSWVQGMLQGDTTVWLEVPASGIFTVDLQKSEFIIDNDRKYVLIRVPKPELTEFGIDEENVKPLHIAEKGWTNVSLGEDKTRELLQNAELSIRQGILENQENYKRAEASTANILENLVKGLNPDIPDLIVEVEFMN